MPATNRFLLKDNDTSIQILKKRVIHPIPKRQSTLDSNSSSKSRTKNMHLETRTLTSLQLIDIYIRNLVFKKRNQVLIIMKTITLPISENVV